MYNKIYSYLVVLRKDNLETYELIDIQILQYFDWMYSDVRAVSYSVEIEKIEKDKKSFLLLVFICPRN